MHYELGWTCKRPGICICHVWLIKEIRDKGCQVCVSQLRRDMQDAWHSLVCGWWAAHRRWRSMEVEEDM